MVDDVAVVACEVVDMGNGAVTNCVIFFESGCERTYIFLFICRPSYVYPRKISLF